MSNFKFSSGLVGASIVNNGPHFFYWWHQCAKGNCFHRNYKVEKIKAHSWIRAQSVPDRHVTLHHSDLSIAWVQSQHDNEKIYMVWNSDSNFSMSLKLA
jgi:hypothetical protein